MEPLELLVIVSVSGCAACVGFFVSQIILEARKAHAIAASEIVVTDTSSGLMRSFLPMARGVGFGVRGMFCGNGKRGFYYGYHNGISRKLASAGNPQGINADEYIGFGIIMFVGSGVFGVLFNLIFELDEYLSLYGAFALWGILAAMWWRAWLARKKDDRQTSIRKMLPFSLDLLTLSIEAGLDFTSSLQRIVRKIGKNPLGQEFALMLHEVQLGKSRTQALRDFANRADVAEVRTVVASLIQAEELGASMGPILRIQAQQQRERRSQRAEEQAMKAPVKMLFPLTVFIFPTVLIMLFVPIALKVWA